MVSNVEFHEIPLLPNFFDTNIGTGYFVDRVGESNRHEFKAVFRSEPLSFLRFFTLEQKVVSHHYFYPLADQYWERNYFTSAFGFNLFKFEHKVAYTKLLTNSGESPFIFDTINDVEDDEISLDSYVSILPFKFLVSTDYQINKESFRNFRYTLGVVVHCWQFDVSIDTVWESISFGVSIPNLTLGN